MEDRTKQFKVGVVVFGTMIAAALLILGNSDFSFSPWRSQYQLQLLVDQAPGVAPDTPVRRRGVLIGRVAEVLDTDEGALITMNIDEGKQIKTNESARIQTSLIGDAVIDFAPVVSVEGAKPVEPGSTIRGTYNPTPLDLIANLQGDLKETISSLGDAGKEVAMLAQRLNQVLGGDDLDRLNRLADSTETAMNSFAEASQNINDIIGDEEFKQQIKEGLAELPSVVADARVIMEALEGALGSADENLKNLQGFTGPLGERGPAIVGSIENGVGSLSELLGEAALLAKSLNNSEGTIGKLTSDREMYDQMLMTLQRVNQMVERFELMSRKLRPILDDVRVFTDKIARDPARIARGIIPKNRETPIK
jgi:phospholipid/cholesterol/gamma-HCH transport system substrate-binding protein